MKNSVFIIGGSAYNIVDPTIKRLGLASRVLEEKGIPERANDFRELFNGMEKKTLCDVLSILISGDCSLADELAQGEKNELIEPLCAIYEDMTQRMTQCIRAAKRICMLCAKQKIQ